MPEEMARHHEEALCFSCPKKFSQDHLKQCSMKGIYLLEMDSDGTMDDTFVDDTGAQITLNALTGTLVYNVIFHLFTSLYNLLN
jgi:hypothetical protein